MTLGLPYRNEWKLTLHHYRIYHYMYHHDQNDINLFRAVGINYKKTDASTRGSFSINEAQYKALLALAGSRGMKQLFVISTCNRTEIYGFAESNEALMQLICDVCGVDMVTLSTLAYTKQGWDAIEHLFNVSSGLDSQILGDYEILGQVKKAAKLAKDEGYVCPFLERMINNALQSSKAVKTRTELSSGTVSVSFAAVQYVKEQITKPQDKKILLVGTGKIGKNTCKNLVDYLGTHNITLINRTGEKAQKLAEELGLKYAGFEMLGAEIAASDIILLSTDAKEPLIVKTHLEGLGNKLVIDLSMPYNIAEDARQLPNVRFVNVDELSKIKDRTLEKRHAEVPQAIAIIKEHLAEFKEWFDMRKYVPMIKEVKLKLQELSTGEIHLSQAPVIAEPGIADEKIQKVINTLAAKMRHENTHGCHYIAAINDFIA